MFKRILAVAAAAALTVSVALPLIAADGEIMIADPFARETPPNAQVGGAYLTIMNHGAANRLTGVSSDAAAMVQLHNHTMDDAGVMRMRRVEGGIPVGMHETVTLAPGGLHIMLMNLVAPLRKGETLDLTLEFEDGSTVDVAVPVMEISASGPMKHDHGAGHGHDTHKHEH